MSVNLQEDQALIRKEHNIVFKLVAKYITSNTSYLNLCKKEGKDLIRLVHENFKKKISVNLVTKLLVKNNLLEKQVRRKKVQKNNPYTKQLKHFTKDKLIYLAMYREEGRDLEELLFTALNDKGFPREVIRKWLVENNLSKE